MTTEMAITRGLVVGATLSLALRHVAWVVAGLMRGTTSGGGRETWPQDR